MPKRRKKIPAPTRASSGEAQYVTPQTLVKRWDGAVTLGTLRNWRSQGRGPPWTKLERAVVYPLADLVEWEKQNTESN
jgi:hypothetical protein